MDNNLNTLNNSTSIDQTSSDNQYDVLPVKASYNMSNSEFGLIVLMLALILITLILICIASNLKSNFKKKMGNLGVVVVSVNGKKQICINNSLNPMFHPAPIDLRTTSFMNIATALPEYVTFLKNSEFEKFKIFLIYSCKSII